MVFGEEGDYDTTGSLRQEARRGDSAPPKISQGGLSKRNTEWYDRLILARARDLGIKFREVSRYRRAFTNWRDVISSLLRLRQFPLVGYTRMGAKVTLHTGVHAQVASYAFDPVSRARLPYEEITLTEEGTLVLVPRGDRQPGPPVRIHGLLQNGDPTVFLQDEYGGLDVAGRTVLDIGANIGDSAIYFGIKGASRVIAVEPFPQTLSIAEFNIQDNHMNDRITLVRGSIGGRSGKYYLSDEHGGATGSTITCAPNGVLTREFSLAELTEKFAIREGVLKMDCEGAEYCAILGASPSALDAFVQIQLEYHYGPKSLVERLKNLGFTVAYGGPRTFMTKNVKTTPMYVGRLMAWREL